MGKQPQWKLGQTPSETVVSGRSTQVFFSAADYAPSATIIDRPVAEEPAMRTATSTSSTPVSSISLDCNVDFITVTR